MKKREFLAMGKMFYTRGAGWVSIFLGFASIATMIKVYEEFFLIQFRMGISTVLTIAIPSYIIACVLIGYFDYKTGIMRAEADISYKAAPLADKQREEVSEILRLMKKQA